MIFLTGDGPGALVCKNTSKTLSSTAASCFSFFSQATLHPFFSPTVSVSQGFMWLLAVDSDGFIFGRGAHPSRFPLCASSWSDGLLTADIHTPVFDRQGSHSPAAQPVWLGYRQGAGKAAGENVEVEMLRVRAGAALQDHNKPLPVPGWSQHWAPGHPEGGGEARRAGRVPVQPWHQLRIHRKPQTNVRTFALKPHECRAPG